MSMVDGGGIGTISLLGGYGCDQGGLTAFPAFPRSHSVGDQQTGLDETRCQQHCKRHLAHTAGRKHYKSDLYTYLYR